MARTKVKLAYVRNDASRKAAYRKRVNGLRKKASELSTLCGVEACAIIYDQHQSQPDQVWPDEQTAERVIHRFRSLPETEKTRKMTNHMDFINERITKTTEKLRKLENLNRDEEMRRVISRMLTGRGCPENLERQDLDKLEDLVNRRLREVCKRMELLKVTPGGDANESVVTPGQVVQKTGSLGITESANFNEPVVTPNQVVYMTDSLEITASANFYEPVVTPNQVIYTTGSLGLTTSACASELVVTPAQVVQTTTTDSLTTTTRVDKGKGILVEDDKHQSFVDLLGPGYVPPEWFAIDEWVNPTTYHNHNQPEEEQQQGMAPEGDDPVMAKCDGGGIDGLWSTKFFRGI